MRSLRLSPSLAIQPAFAVTTLALISAFMTTPSSSRAQDADKPEPAADATEAAAPDAAAADADLVKRFSYAYGVVLGRRLNEDGAKLDIEQFAAGYAEATGDGEPSLTDEQLQATFKEHEDFIRGGFLRDNAAREEVKVTESGLQYEIIEKGDGPMPKATDSVKVHYKGTLTSGEQFDSSYDRGEPISFPLNGVIAGWTEGVQLMPVGSKFRFVIPYDLAYGEQGRPPQIPAKATLVFIIELLGIE